MFSDGVVEARGADGSFFGADRLVDLLGRAEAARELRAVRAGIRAAHAMSLRELYRTLELPGANRLRDAQDALDRAVGEAYAWGLPPALRELVIADLEAGS